MQPSKITPVVGGTVDSFIHTGKGKQNFDNSNIKSGATIHNPDRGSIPYIGGTVGSFLLKDDGDQSFAGADIQSGGNIKCYNISIVVSCFIGCLTSPPFSSCWGVSSSLGVFLSASPVQEVKEKEEDGTKDLWAKLEKIGVEDDSLGGVYWYLINNPNALKAFNGVPIHKRKQMLPIIVPNYRPKGSDRNVKLI